MLIGRQVTIGRCWPALCLCLAAFHPLCRRRRRRELKAQSGRNLVFLLHRVMHRERESEREREREGERERERERERESGREGGGERKI